MVKIRILLAENHGTVRAGLRLLLDAQNDMRVVAEAANGEEALERMRALSPDVAVLDLTMPGTGGVEVARALNASVTPVQTKIVVLTRHDDDGYVRELMSAGARAYVLKHSGSNVLIDAIRAAARDEVYLDAAVQRDTSNGRDTKSTMTATPRERDVLRLTASGYTNKEIAAQLRISARTVEVHKASAMRKLNLIGRADVVRYAVLHGWMTDL